MTTRFISLATVIVLLDVYLQSQLSSNDPLFLFASSNTIVNAGLLIIASLMVAVSFRGKFKHWWTYLACAVTAVTFGLIGLIGTFFDNLLYSFPQVLLQLDYMFLLEAGVVFGICALTYQHEKLPFKLSLPAPASLLHNIAFPVPKIPHSPTGLNRTSISGSH